MLLILGVGTGVNATVFSLVDALLFRPPAGILRPSRLAAVYTSEFGGQAYGYSSYPDYLSLKAGVPDVETLAAIDDGVTATLRIGDATYSVRAAGVSPEFFAALGLPAARGQLVPPEPAGAHPPAVIVYKLWERVFQLDEQTPGRTISIDGNDYTVVGIAPARFEGLQVGRDSDVWIPLGLSSASPDRGNRRLSLFGRLRSGRTFADAQRQVNDVAVRLAGEHPGTNRGTIASADAPRSMSVLRYSRLDPATRSRTAVISALLLGATVMVLLSACAGAGALLLSRATSRVTEIGVRFALGASRTRLVRQLLTDSVAISLAGGAFGLLLSYWTAGAIPSLFASEHAEMLTPRLDVRVFLFTLAIAVLAGALFGLAPAVLATNPVVALALRSDPGSVSSAAGGARLRGTLVIAQIALSIVLLVSTLQLIRGLTGALSTPASVIASRVAVATVLLPGRYENQVGGIRYKNDATDYLRGLPGVESVEWVSSLPLAADNARAFLIPRDGTGLTEHAELQIVSVSTGYFAAMGIPRLVGRVFDSRDHARAPPVLVVNDVLAQRYFGEPRLALERHLLDASGQRLEIVGVVESARYRTLQPPPAPIVYYSATQNYHVRMNVVVKSSRDPQSLVEPIRQTLKTTDSKADVLKAMTLSQHLSEALVMERLTTVLVGTCGLMTMVLAIVGVYGVMADAVIRRTRELGVRMALGARRLRIVQLVLTQGLRLAASGVAVGVVGAFAAMRLLQWLVQGVAPLDTPTFVLIPAVLALMVVLASVLPVRRALAVNPTVALRHE